MRSPRATARCASATLIGLLLLAGCSAEQDDTAAGGPSLPPRPASLDILQVDPCTMLDPAQRTALAVGPGRPGEATVNGAPTRGCVWLGEDMDLNAQTFPIGAEQALTDPTAVPATVAGYGAVQTWVATRASATPPICLITIDTADGQGLRVQASPGPGERADPDAERPAICARAQELAEAVMTTIRQ